VRIRLPIKSTADLAAIFNRQLRNASVLSLGTGQVQGYVDVYALKNLRLFRISLNTSVAIYADRIPGKRMFSLDLSPSTPTECIQAQGVSLTRPALFGFNYNLKDLDLVLPACSNMCVIALSDKFFLSQLENLTCLDVLETLDKFNVLANSSVSSELFIALTECWSFQRLVSDDIIESQILGALIQCLDDTNQRKVARPSSRQDRHNAALRILSMTFADPARPFEIQDLANLLHQSRTSIFNGCKEKFGMSPVQIIRSVRLHQVHHALLDVEFSARNNLNGVVDTAEYFGFVGRSHFARHYKNEFTETPRQTLARRCKSEQMF
jgi:AraC-like DNA-binding protein